MIKNYEDERDLKMYPVQVVTTKPSTWKDLRASALLRQIELWVVGITPPDEVIKRQGYLKGEANLWIVDVLSCPHRQAIFAALFLRNQGYNVLLCRLDDIPKQLPADLIEQIQRAMVSAFVSGDTIRTEIVVSEWAMEFLGDITSEVSYFEREFLS